MSLADYRPVSRGYAIALIVALGGLTAVITGLAGGIDRIEGRDPIDAMGWPGRLAFVTSFGLFFLTRLIFWKKSSPATQQLVRQGLSLALVLELIAAASGLVLAVATSGTGADAAFVPFMAVFGAIAQVGTLTWLIRYRRE